MITLLAFIGAIALLVVFHELGHYWVARRCGVKVLGDVPRDTPAAAAQLRAGDTIRGINGEAVPNWDELRWMLLELVLQSDSGPAHQQGMEQARERGEVRIETQDASGVTSFHLLNIGSLETKDLDGEFLNKLGLRPYQPPIPPVIGKVAENSVAQRAGLRPGDRILQADGAAMQRWNELVDVVRKRPGQAVRLDIRRGEITLSILVTPQAVAESGKTVGKIGAAPQVDQAAWQALLAEVSYGPLEALERSLRRTWETSIVSLKMMGKMAQGDISMKNLSGPITIADYAGQSAEMGVAAYLGFLSLISISLGVLNLLPIPLLDGGHLLYYVAELVKGSPVSERIWEIGQKIGIVLLGVLMVFAIYNDINRIISG